MSPVGPVGSVRGHGGPATPAPGSGVSLRYEWPMLLAMVLVYVILLGTFTLVSVLTAVVVVLVLRWVFPLPALPRDASLHPVGMVRLIARVLLEMARASGQIAWLAVRPGPPPATSVVAVRLRTDSDVVAVTTSMIITLLPGSLLVDLDRPSSTLYVHALGTHDPGQAAKDQVAMIEHRVAEALGSAQDRQRCGGTS